MSNEGNVDLEESKDMVSDIPETETEHDHDVYCVRCGRQVADAPLTVSEEVMQEYTRSLLGQRPFTKTLTLFNGALRLTFEILSAEQRGLIDSQKMSMNFDTTLDLTLLATLALVETFDFDLHVSTPVYSANYAERLAYCKNVPKSVHEVFGNIDTTRLNIYKRCAMSFDVLCRALTEQVFNTDFYDGIGLF